MALAERCDRLTPAAQRNPLASLGVTPREAEVLACLAEGISNKEVAVRLGLSPRTVEKHVESLLRKTGTRSRTELALLASSPPARSS